MSTESFKDRGDALENAFFADVDAKLMDKLRASLEKDKSVDELSALSGINDRGVLSALADAGVTGRSITALHVFPLVAVAWADGLIQKEEREKVIEAATEQGMTKDSPALALLEAWLQSKPDDSVFAAWESYAKSLIAKLGSDEAKSIRKSITGSIQSVAEASGGVLGWRAVSKGESEIMKRIEAALTSSK
jgi:hypothetical protein